MFEYLEAIVANSEVCGGPGGNGTGTVVAFPYTLCRLSEAKKGAGQEGPRWKKPRLLLGGLDP